MQPNTGELYLPPPNTTSRPVSVGLRRPSRRALVAATAALALSLTACGSRLGQARLEATNNVFKKVVDSQSAAAGPAAAPGAATDTNATTAGGAGTGAAAPGVAVATGGVSSSLGGAATAGAGSATASRATGSAGSTSGGATVSGGPAANAGSAAAKPGLPAPGAPGGPAPAPGAGGPKSEIVLGSFGAESGILGAVSGPDKGQAWGVLLTVASHTDKKKLGILYCREATTCSVQMNSFKKLLPWNGLEEVYEAQVSLAQPDYTAEMLQAQRSGAEVILSLIDSASVARVAQSAHRQGYNPIFAGTYNLNQDLIFAGGKEVDGLLLTSRTPPWDSSPKMQFYRDAMDRYQPKAYRGDLGGGVFVVGKVLEEKIGPFIGEPPTTAQILQGLYALHNETLGGLLPGVGFVHGEHFTTNQCVVPVKLTGGKFVAHDAAESFVCAPGWKPAA